MKRKSKNCEWFRNNGNHTFTCFIGVLGCPRKPFGVCSVEKCKPFKKRYKKPNIFVQLKFKNYD